MLATQNNYMQMNNYFSSPLNIKTPAPKRPMSKVGRSPSNLNEVVYKINYPKKQYKPLIINHKHQLRPKASNIHSREKKLEQHLNVEKRSRNRMPST